MADIDDLARAAVADPVGQPPSLSELSGRVGRRRRRRRVTLGAAAILALVVGVVGAGLLLDKPDDEPGVVAGEGEDDEPGDTAAPTLTSPPDLTPAAVDLGLDGLFDRPATPEDEFPYDEFTRGWLIVWDDPHFSIYQRLNFDASRSVSFDEDVPAFAIPTHNRDAVCLVFAFEPPGWFPDVDSVQPIRCVEAETFVAEGISIRSCGPGDRWVTMALVPIGVRPEAVEPYGTLHESGAAILFDGFGPEQPIELDWAPSKVVQVEGRPFGTDPGDGSVPCPGA